MTSVTLSLKRFTGFFHSPTFPKPEVWVNPSVIAYAEPRIVMRHSAEVVDGTRLYFNVDGGVLDVREDVGYVVAVLQSGNGGVCRDCYQLLAESWASLCGDCRRQRHAGVDADPEEAAA